jgi:hypothetical protein
MIIKDEQFSKLASQGKVQVKLPLKKHKPMWTPWGNLGCYDGKEKKVWCTIEEYNGFKIIENYKVRVQSIDQNYNGRDFYTSDLVSLINSGYIEMKIIN